MQITVRFGFEERDDKESGDTMIDSLAESYLSGGLSGEWAGWNGGGAVLCCLTAGILSS